MRDDHDAYHEYLWGEASPRAFARARSVKRTLVARIDDDVDPARFVAR